MLISEPFTAGQSKTYKTPGAMFLLRSAFFPVDVQLYRNGKRLNSDLDQALSGDGAVPPGGFNQVEITSSETQTVSFWIVPGAIFSQRIAGEVSVVDGGAARTLAGQSFSGSASEGPVSAQFSYVQLWNASTTHRFLVYRIVLSTPAAQRMKLTHGALALTTVGSAPENKMTVGSQSPNAQMRGQSSAGNIGNFLGSVGFVGASNPILLESNDPYIVGPGNGLIVGGETLNTAVNAFFDFREEEV